MVEAALAPEFDSSVGSRVGAELVAAHFTGTETLSNEARCGRDLS